MSLSETIKELEVNQLAPIILGGGNKIESQVPQAETRVLSGEKIFLLTDGETFEMPDIIGWSKRDVMKLSELLNLNINVMGSGFAQRQSVSVGNTIRKGDYLVVEFSPFELLGKDGDQDAQEDLLNDELERIYLD
ncbi:MAG: PASTA domain-containing protein [Bacillaceae bacterium]|nr:PASTA domain-containing protein [Bacillaceae bacterium]